MGFWAWYQCFLGCGDSPHMCILTQETFTSASARSVCLHVPCLLVLEMERLFCAACGECCLCLLHKVQLLLLSLGSLSA